MSKTAHPKQSLESASSRHRTVLEDRGYVIEKQANLDNHLARNSPWKTYWLATHKRYGSVFVKINYGYSRVINRSMGEKEARLPEFFSDGFAGRKGVRFPKVAESWECTDGYFVAFEWEEMEERSGFGILLDDRLRDGFVRLLKTWDGISLPRWWSSEHVLHDFALDESYREDDREVSPFGFDLDDNLAVVGAGDLFVYDFEFVQWSNPCLQTVYIAQKYLTESRKMFLETLRGKGPITSMLDGVSGRVRRNTIQQGWMVHRRKMDRNDEASWQRRMFGVLARKLIERRTLTGSNKGTSNRDGSR